TPTVGQRSASSGRPTSRAARCAGARRSRHRGWNGRRVRGGCRRGGRALRATSPGGDGDARAGRVLGGASHGGGAAAEVGGAPRRVVLGHRRAGGLRGNTAWIEDGGRRARVPRSPLVFACRFARARDA